VLHDRWVLGSVANVVFSDGVAVNLVVLVVPENGVLVVNGQTPILLGSRAGGMTRRCPEPDGDGSNYGAV